MLLNVQTVLLALTILSSSYGFLIQESEWNDYKALYGKVYNNFGTDGIRRFYFALNKVKIKIHNDRYDRGLESYRLQVNQFSDYSYFEVLAMFPPTANVPFNGVPFNAPKILPPSSFSYTDQGYKSSVQNQGLTCNSGWAYATATALQIFHASNTGNLNSQTLSAQNLIDCAGEATACRNQVPQTAFDYLTKQSQKIYPQSEYPKNPNGNQGMCVLPATSTNAKTLKSYSTIPDGNDETLRSVLNFVSPVVIKVNPTFEFIHYKEGIFSQPTALVSAAHYITVLGYKASTGTSKGVWLVQNSFGLTWGEQGMMRIEMNPARPITNSAIFPTE